MTVILRYFTKFSIVFRTHYVVVEDRPTSILFSGKKICSPKHLVFSDISLMAIFAEVTENECDIDRSSAILDEETYAILHCFFTQYYFEIQLQV